MTVILTASAFVAGFVQFVYYCRSALSSARKSRPSSEVFRITGIENATSTSRDFECFRQLVEICPGQKQDGPQVRAIAVYYKLLGMLGNASKDLIPAISLWALEEQQSCAHFAAVVLDRRISWNRDQLVNQAMNRL